ncbi:MAG TPA: FKBP-type peptidyl-prolyl cis-trans isomerase [Methylomirabilota bacterium]|jgi:FKBP-type peptidyl-prolyl cis-trans isomerase|nr:FKBP-type peptidyl-prolyl cis-trans isomerase [Methylomirabilota bacterium]
MSKPFLALGVCLALGVASCNETTEKSGTMTEQSTSATTTPTASTSAPAAPALPGAPGSGNKMHKLASGLQYDDLVVGSGKMAEPGVNVAVHYTGYLLDGTEFDSSLKSGQPLKFQIAGGQMIAGFDEGVRGMRIGGKRKIVVPYAMGYGEAGSGPIPPKSDLVFDLELIDAK